MTSTQPTLVLLGGVPGAGKTVALRALESSTPLVRIVDSHDVRRRLAAKAGWVPYALCRPVVHVVAHVVVLVQLLRRGAGPLVVHDPGTRWWSRRLLLRLALRLGYAPTAVFIDIDRAAALQGQSARGRMVRPAAFERHWQRWLRLRERIAAGAELSWGERWPHIVVTVRERAVAEVLLALGGTAAPHAQGPRAQEPHTQGPPRTPGSHIHGPRTQGPRTPSAA